MLLKSLLIRFLKKVCSTMIMVLPNRKLFYLLAALTIYSAFWILYNFRLYKINLLSAKDSEQERLGCDLPYLDPFNKEFTEKYYHSKPIKCIKKDWVKCGFLKCQVVDEVLINMDNVVCFYQDILYDSNQTIVFGSPQKVQGNDAYLLKLSDHVFVSCTASPLHLFNNKSGSFPTSTSWAGRGSGLRPLRRSYLNERSINVLILVFQSLSHNGFLRMFPVSNEFIMRFLNATVLKKYNIAGNPDRIDIHSFLPPFFFDKDTLRSFDGGGDAIAANTIILSKLKFIEGFRTALFKDQFTYDKSNDWLRPLIDHTFLQDTNRSNPDHSCVGNKPKIQYMFDLIRQFTDIAENKFGLFFIPDINKYFILNADKLLLGLLQHLMLHRIHENTLIILMSDHGQRTGSIRNTYQGNIEEKLPFMAISVPDSLESIRQKNIRKFLYENAEVLVTPRDIYATLLDAINVRQHFGSNLQSTEGPSMSLLKPIPYNRTCYDAGISAYWCACTKWKEVLSTNPLHQRAASALLEHINSLPMSNGYLLARIEWVKQGPTQDMHKNTRIYNVKVVVQPGPVTFEAGIKYNINEDKFIVNVEETFRLDD